MASAVIHDRTCPAGREPGGECDCGAAFGADEAERRPASSRLPETMAVVPGRLLEMTAVLEVDPVRGIWLGASSLEKTLRVVLEATDETVPVARRVRVRLEVNPSPASATVTELREAADELIECASQNWDAPYKARAIARFRAALEVLS